MSDIVATGLAVSYSNMSSLYDCRCYDKVALYNVIRLLNTIFYSYGPKIVYSFGSRSWKLHDPLLLLSLLLLLLIH